MYSVCQGLGIMSPRVAASSIGVVAVIRLYVFVVVVVSDWGTAPSAVLKAVSLTASIPVVVCILSRKNNSARIE